MKHKPKLTKKDIVEDVVIYNQVFEKICHAESLNDLRERDAKSYVELVRLREAIKELKNKIISYETDKDTLVSVYQVWDEIDKVFGGVLKK